MKRRHTLPDLAAALEWLRERWSVRDVPTRLHNREHDGWGLAFAPAFAMYLDADPNETFTPSVGCTHPGLLRGADWRLCHDCSGTGTKPARYTEWRYPTWRAMEALRADDRTHPGRAPTLVDVILTIVINAFDAGDVARTGIPEPTQFLAIRELFNRYELRPAQKTRFTEKSESQRNAEGTMVMAGAAA